MQKYYYSDGSQQFGPFTLEELKHKGLTKETLVWYEGLTEWQIAGNVQELTDLFPTQAAPAPPPISAPPPPPTPAPPPEPIPPSPPPAQPQYAPPPQQQQYSLPPNQLPAKKSMIKPILFGGGAIILVVILYFLFMMDNTPEFQSFTSNEGAFTVQMRGAPTQDIKQFSTEAGTINMIMFTSDIGTASYLVAYSDFPQQIVNAQNTLDLLEGVINGTVNELNAKLLSLDFVKLRGEDGVEFVGEGNKEGKNVRVQGRNFLVGNRLYQINVIIEKGIVPQADIDKFLNSFQFDF